jgi:hypothetical protein
MFSEWGSDQRLAVSFQFARITQPEIETNNLHDSVSTGLTTDN